MKNVNYNLIKLLHCISDIEWRINKHYLEDADECDGCKEILEKIKNDASEQVKLLVDEIQKHGRME